MRWWWWLFSRSVVSTSLRPRGLLHARPGFPVLRHLPGLLKLLSIESVMPPSHLILCRPLLLLPPILPSIRVFSSESALRVRWPLWASHSRREQKKEVKIKPALLPRFFQTRINAHKRVKNMSRLAKLLMSFNLEKDTPQPQAQSGL